MYILEESQLLEDTIEDPKLLELYRTLNKNESSSVRAQISTILANSKVLVVAKQILNLGDVSEKVLSLTNEQKDSLLQELCLTKSDVASLFLIVAGTFTQLFVIDNFTGPATSGLTAYLDLPEVYSNLQDKFDYRSLTISGCEVHHMVINPWLLKCARSCWDILGTFGVSRRLLELEFLVWKHRYLSVYLALLHETPEIILKDLKKIQEFIFDHYMINDMRENKTQLVRFNPVELCCELIQSAILRDSITTSRKILEYVSEISSISIEHTGVLGRRTKYQQSDVPQLVIRVNKTNLDASSRLDVQTSDLPKDIELDDDTLLPDVSFVKGDGDHNSEVTEQDLSPEAQLLMLAKLDYILKTEVMEESLKDEWTLAYLRSIIKSSTIWAVKYKALALRSVVEKKQMRKMDRALRQYEDLIKLSTDANQAYGCDARLQSFYSVMPLPRWRMQKSLGDISFDLCLFKNALEVYSRIEYWEGIIKCYSCLGETVKAETIITQELKKQETPYLYCLLGDATENLEYYEKSWALSGERFARAKKSIGTYYYVRKDYEKAIDNYEQAYKASPSNVSILSLLAYSCLTTERYERAAECYRNLTYQDDTSYLFWNNLSKAYIKLDQKERAWRTLREAIKCNFEEWKIWENFMLVSIEIGAYDDVIEAWNRIIDIKKSHKDDQILSALTYSLLQLSYHKSDQEFKKLLGDAIKLTARIGTTGASSPRTWICYFRLLARDHDLNLRHGKSLMSNLDIDSSVSKMMGALQRATPKFINSDWYKLPEMVNELLDRYDELLDCYALAINMLGLRREVESQWKSFKLAVNNSLKVLKKEGYSAI